VYLASFYKLTSVSFNGESRKPGINQISVANRAKVREQQISQLHFHGDGHHQDNQYFGN
jgi:hypothetical protein